MEFLLLWGLLQINTIDPSVGYPNDLPKIEYKTECELYQYFEGTDDCPLSWDEVELRAVAMYIPNEKTIYLSTEFNENKTVDQSILIHELYHYVQDVSGKAWKDTADGKCMAEAWEKDAYAMQFDWLESRGLNPYVVSGLNPISLKLLTTCGSYY